MKKILIVSAVFLPEQVTSALMNFDLAIELAKDYEVTVLRPYPTRPLGAKFNTVEVGENSFTTIIVNSYTHPQSELFGRFKESNDFGNKVVEYIENNHRRIGFIYNDGWQLFALYKVSKVANKYNIPYMLPVQDIYPECLFTNKSYPKLLSSIIYKLLFPIDKYNQKHATSIRTISNEMCNYLSESRNIPKDKYLVVNNWQNDEDFLEDYPSRVVDGKIVFAYVGSINSHANVELIIKAFTEANISNSELKIYGGGNHKNQCVELVNSLNVKNIFFDMVSRDKVAFVQSKADVLVLALPKGNGNFCLPSKITSYMLSGKPILASVDSDSATTRYIKTAGCGLSVQPDSIDSLKEGFLYFANMDICKLKEIGINSFNYSRQYLTREASLQSVLKVIKSIINN